MGTEFELAADAISDLYNYLEDIQDQLREVRDYINTNVANEGAYGELLKPINTAVKTHVVNNAYSAISTAIFKQGQPQKEIWKVGQQLDNLDGEVSDFFKYNPYVTPTPKTLHGRPGGPTY